jgi:hypothetical protein
MDGDLMASQPAPVTDPVKEKLGTTPQQAQALHRRDVFYKVDVPLYLGGLALIALIVLVAMFTNLAPAEMGMVADFMAIFFLLLPMVLCLLPVYVIFMIVAFGAGALNNFTGRQFNRLNRLTYNIAEKTVNVTAAIDKRALDARVKVAGAESLMEHAFDKDNHTVEKEA